MSRSSRLSIDLDRTERFMETHAVLIQRNIEYRNYQQGRKGDARSPLVMELAELARMEFGYSAATNDLDIVRSIITYFKQRKVA